MDRPRVILAADDYYASLAAVRALRAGGYDPVAAVAGAPTYAERSRAVSAVVRLPSPDADVEAYVAALACAASELGAAAVAPGTETSLVALADRDAAFPCPVAVPGAAVVARATDKALLTGLAAAAGLRTPPGVEVDGTVPADLPLPGVLKPVRSTVEADGRTVALPSARRVSTRAEIEAQIRGYPPAPWLVQPYLRGDLVAVAGVAWRGELVCAVHQEAIRIFPPDAGTSAYARTVPPDAALERGVARILADIGWSGIFEAQFVRAAGFLYLIDLNPRVYGSLALAVGAGANLPAAWLDLVLGHRPRAVRYRAGVGFRAEERDVRALAAAAAAGRWREAFAGALPRRRTAHAVFSVRDPGPLVLLAHRGAAATRKAVKRASRRTRSARIRRS